MAFLVALFSSRHATRFEAPAHSCFSLTASTGYAIGAAEMPESLARVGSDDGQCKASSRRSAFSLANAAQASPGHYFFFWFLIVTVVARCHANWMLPACVVVDECSTLRQCTSRMRLSELACRLTMLRLRGMYIHLRRQVVELSRLCT